ncbi:MAG: hypothetical protein Q7S46_12815, partial [Gallionella sp.]|nr:hypothetical protein [Gallionella sp.]
PPNPPTPQPPCQGENQGRRKTVRNPAIEFNPDNPLGRRSGEGRNPAIKDTPRSRQHHDVVPHPATRYWRSQPFAGAGVRRPFPPLMLCNAVSWPPLMWGIFNHLDTGLRRYDTVFSNELFGFNRRFLRYKKHHAIWKWLLRLSKNRNVSWNSVWLLRFRGSSISVFFVL